MFSFEWKKELNVSLAKQQYFNKMNTYVKWIFLLI